jgi:putative photosynthetic complex assembly protein 2
MIPAMAAAALYTLFVWWFSTGAILWLDRRPRTTYGWSLAGATVVAVGATGVLAATRADATPKGAVIAFTAALAIWGWHELSFLTGFLTGPSAKACPDGATGWRRFSRAAATLLYHEAALALTALALAALTFGHANPIGGLTFLILFAARLSAKLNLFVGVPNFTDAFFPEHLRHLKSYLRRRPAGLFYAVSVSTGCALLALLAWRAADPADTTFDGVGLSLLFTLTALALLEHAFMALPLPDAALWRWALPAAEKHPAPLPIDL